MPEHEVHFKLPERSIMNSDASFFIYSDDKLLGEMKISRGSLEWRPAGFTNEKGGYHISWEEFNELMQKEGSRR